MSDQLINMLTMLVIDDVFSNLVQIHESHKAATGHITREAATQDLVPGVWGELIGKANNRW